MENTSEKTFSLDDYDFENIPSNYFDRLKIAHKYHSTDYIVTRYEQIISKLMYMDIENKSIILAKIKKAFSILSNKLNCMKYLSLLESNDYNSILDISIDDKIDVIRKSYNKLIRTHHPDKYGDKDVSEKIQEAFNVLSDEKKRRNYDKTIKQYYDLKDEKIKYNEQFEQNIMNVTQDMMNDGIEKIKNNDLIDDNMKSSREYRSEWRIVRFADKVKNIVCLIIGCTREQLEDEQFKNTKLSEEWIRYGYANGFSHVYKDGEKETVMNNEPCSKERYEQERITNWQTAIKLY